MKIAIASMGNPQAVETWSGIPSHIFSALAEQGHELVGIELIQPVEPWHYAWQRRLYYHLHGRWFLRDVDGQWLKEISNQLDVEVEKINPDIVILFHGDFLAHSTFKHPVCFIHDATWATLVNYYPAFSNLTSRSIKSGHDMYKRAIERSDAAVFSSEWASKSAINDYQATPNKVHTIPLGANIKEAPDSGVIESEIVRRSKSDECNLLFLGIDWERKGGPDALRFVIELNKLGISSHLIVAGCTPEIVPEYEKYVQKQGFLRKDIEADSKKLETLFIESHALLLPSLAECYGCVYCEANAYGLPALGRDTGGVSEIIKEGFNGMLLRKGEAPEEFANRWAILWNNKEAYYQIAINSRREFDNRLNYQTFVEKLEPILVNILQKKVGQIT